MNPNITVGYMAEQINRERLNGLATRSSRIEEAYTASSQPVSPAQVPLILGAALIRLGAWIQGTVRSAGTPAEPVALAAR